MQIKSNMYYLCVVNEIIYRCQRDRTGWDCVTWKSERGPRGHDDIPPPFLVNGSFHSFHLKLICGLILLYFYVDLSWFCLDGSNFHQIILSLFIEGAPRSGLYDITPNLEGGASMDRSPFRMCFWQTSQTVVDYVHIQCYIKDMLCFGKNRSSDHHREYVQQTSSNLTWPYDSAKYFNLV